MSARAEDLFQRMDAELKRLAKQGRPRVVVGTSGSEGHFSIKIIRGDSGTSTEKQKQTA